MLNKKVDTPLLQIGKPLFFGQFRWVYLVAVLFALGDFSQRFSIDSMPEARSGSDKKVTLALPKSKMPTQVYDSYMGKLANFRVPEVESVGEVPAAATSEEVSQYDWLGSNFSYRLAGIFFDKQSFAVLQRTNNASLSKDTLKVIKGDIVEGFEIIEISRHQLKAVGPQNIPVSLTMFVKNK